MNLLQMLDETLSICAAGSYLAEGTPVQLKLTQEQQKHSIYISEQAVRKCVAFEAERSCGSRECIYTTTLVDTFEAAAELTQGGCEDGTILALNFANPFCPGGGVRRGARAQEEDLCRKSTLLASLESDNSAVYYSRHREESTYLSSDAMLLTPQVEIFRDTKGRLLRETKVVAVLTCAAPIVNEDVYDVTSQELEQILRDRIRGMLSVAAHYGYHNLVLGAWGCGAFGNDAKVVANLFYEELAQFSCFEKVVFAIKDNSWDKYNYRQFAERFAHFQ